MELNQNAINDQRALRIFSSFRFIFFKILKYFVGWDMTSLLSSILRMIEEVNISNMVILFMYRYIHPLNI